MNRTSIGRRIYARGFVVSILYPNTGIWGNYAEIHQDNVIAQMLETNGKFSSSRKTKHIKAKFFFIKDKVNSEEVKIVDFPAGVMYENVLTKPLQGTEFRKMRAQLKNCAME